MNIEGARLVCAEAGVGDEAFYMAISTFKGAARRLEVVKRGDNKVVFRDFAHSPSKVRATIAAVREQFPAWHLVACLELHTFSSLNEHFLAEYAGSMDEADSAAVYFNPHTLEHKKLKPITAEQVRNSFSNDQVHVFNEPEALSAWVNGSIREKTVVLMMSSGTFDGVRLDAL